MVNGELRPALQRMKIYPVLEELKSCLCNKVGGDEMCFCGIIVGEGIPVEYAGNCESIGAAYVRLVNGFPSTTQFPNADEANHSPSLRAWTITVGILRSAPYGEGMEAPHPEDVEQLSLDLLSDAQILWETISCCIGDDKFDLQFLRGEYSALPNDGGVAGGEWSLIVQDPS